MINTQVANPASLSFNAPGLNAPGSAQLSGRISLGTSFGFALDAVGREVTRVFDPGDSDGDGVPDADDRCVSSILDATVSIDGCDSGVTNTVSGDGCSITDEVLLCDQGGNHGSFVSCVAGTLRDLGLAGRQRGAIQSCAARSSR